MPWKHPLNKISKLHLFFPWIWILAALNGWAQTPDPAIFNQLEFRQIGPVGNRVSAVTGVPGDPNIFYIGAASGGVWKTIDGGANWSPVFDEQEAQSIGSLAIADSDPNIVWAGTGEANIRSNISIGNGVYKSTDGGKTWKHMGLEKTGRISRLAIHPTNPDIVYVAALGHCYGPQQERGVYRTFNGGETWERVLFTNPDSGASDLIMDPNNPRILYAGMWQMVIWTWGRQSGGPGSGLYKSTDGGSTWKKLEGNGLPTGTWGKVALSMSKSNSDRVYALIETNSHNDFEPLEEHEGVLWRSDDAGENWDMVNADHTLAQRPHYYSRVVAQPADYNEVYFMSTRASVSYDGGETFQNFPSGGDNHDIWIDPLIPDRLIVGHDGGLSISTTRGKTWFRPQLPIAQIYHVFTDNQIPYNVYGNRQDGSSMAGPSNTLESGPIPIGAWHSVGGCESGFAVPDPVENNIVWSGCYEGILDRNDQNTGHSRNVQVWPENAESWPAEGLRYRFQWTFPILISPHDHNRVYVGSQYVHVTEDGGQSWEVISPDLSTNDKSKQKKTGGLTPDDAGPTIGTVIFALAESPVEQGVLWAGTNDGLLHVSRDNGGNWTNVTANIPNLPPWGTVSNIEASRYAAGSAYVSVDFHQVNDTRPYVYKTTDYGQTWTSLSSNLPHTVFSYVHVIREDPVRQGLLYLGSENSLYVSFDDGGRWIPFQTNLPHVPVHWLTVQEQFNDLVLATYGRGFWILDDITPLRQLDEQVLDDAVHLFDPRPAYRFRTREEHMKQPGDPVSGENPRYGASIHFYLHEKPEENIKLEILDSSGAVVRTLDRLQRNAEAGINRVYWNLRLKESRRPSLQTKPLEHSHVPLGDDGTRSLAEGRSISPPALPGEYTLRLSVGDTVQETKLTVLKDPNTTGTAADVAEQYRVIVELRDMLNQAVDVINEVESERRQLLDKEALIRGREGAGEVRDRSQTVREHLREFEGNFFDLRLTNARQDTLRWPRRLYSRIGILAGTIDQGDYPPTSQQLEVLDLYRQRLQNLTQELERIRREELAPLNRLLQEKGFSGIVTR